MSFLHWSCFSLWFNNSRFEIIITVVVKLRFFRYCLWFCLCNRLRGWSIRSIQILIRIIKAHNFFSSYLLCGNWFYVFIFRVLLFFCLFRWNWLLIFILIVKVYNFFSCSLFSGNLLLSLWNSVPF